MTTKRKKKVYYAVFLPPWAKLPTHIFAFRSDAVEHCLGLGRIVPVHITPITPPRKKKR